MLKYNEKGVWVLLYQIYTTVNRLIIITKLILLLVEASHALYSGYLTFLSFQFPNGKQCRENITDYNNYTLKYTDFLISKPNANRNNISTSLEIRIAVNLIRIVIVTFIEHNTIYR